MNPRLDKVISDLRDVIDRQVTEENSKQGKNL